MILNSKKCVICGKQATHKFVKVEKNQIYDMYYCPEHAAQKSPYQKPKMPLTEILANFLTQGEAAQQALTFDPDLKCEKCGLPFEAYRKSLILGCPGCYESFYKQLLPDLRKFHGHTKHLGRKPGGGKETSEEAAPVVEIEETTPPPKKSSKSSQPPTPATQGASALLKNPAHAIQELTRTMNKAIQEEDFERAARCRDQIKEIQDTMKTESKGE